MPALTKISPQQLFRQIGTPKAPAIIDICIDEDFAIDPRLIPGAYKVPHTQIEREAPSLHGRKCIIICQKGKKLSAGAAALLRTHGIDAENLEGGAVGWASEGLPMVPFAKLPQHDADGRTLWVTRQRPKVERIACPWLIRRFIDPKARFLFVPAQDVEGVAERFGATAFDAPDAPFTHQGDRCTFDAMLDEFELEIPALRKMADIIRAADTGKPDDEPQGHGLLAFSLGLSRMIRNDLDQLEAGLTLYDALYHWARDAQDESHDWHEAS